jgi:asparagine synthase (glutamine-hydrolysing)
MCGVAGFISKGAVGACRAESILADMARPLEQRGPDGQGLWWADGGQVGLAHRRLSILDVSAAGSQPMQSADGRFTISFNGEIYNHSALRMELVKAGHSFRGHSDTEVLLASIVEWGLAAALRKFIGMFAFALWDSAQKKLSLAVDRLGEKPLYYGFAGRDLVFGSQLSALKPHPQWRGEIDPDAVRQFLSRGYILAPLTIYRGVRKMEPGSFCVVTQFDLASNCLPERVIYWSVDAILQAGVADPFVGSDVAAVDELDRLMKEAINLQMVADVPVGAFLSGGVDSSLVVALMQAQSTRRVRTFSIGFAEDEFNEAVHARSVAAHLGTDHTEFTVSAEDALAVVPQIPEIYDEPFADSSQIPTYLVARLARKQVTVSLSGDGADELFLGYRTYQHVRRLWNATRWLPHPVCRVAGSLLGRAGTPTSWNQRMSGRRLSRWRTLGRVFPSKSMVEMHLRLGALDADRLLSRDTFGVDLEPTIPTFQTGGDRMTDLGATDIKSYLPGDILVKVDRAGMAVSLETRIPFLDHRVVEFALRLPDTFKLRHDRGKWVVREVLDRYVPRALIERPKRGFAIPLAAWLRGPLRDWGESLLTDRALATNPFLDRKAVQKCWTEHQSGAADNPSLLWNVLTLQSWLQHASSKPKMRDQGSVEIVSQRPESREI